MEAMPLVSTRWLSDWLADPDLVVVDASVLKCSAVSGARLAQRAGGVRNARPRPGRAIRQSDLRLLQPFQQAQSAPGAIWLWSGSEH